MKIKVVCIRCHDTPLLAGEVRYISPPVDKTNPSWVYKPLEVGKVYEVYSDLFYYYVNGFLENKTDFIELSEYRKKKLEAIGI